MPKRKSRIPCYVLVETVRANSCPVIEVKPILSKLVDLHELEMKVGTVIDIKGGGNHGRRNHPRRRQ